MRTILVSVLKDLLGFYPDGYEKNIPVDIYIGEIKTLTDPSIDGSVEALEISHPDFGLIYVDETVDSIREKIQQATGGGSTAPASTYGQGTITNGNDHLDIVHGLGKVPNWIGVTPLTVTNDEALQNFVTWCIVDGSITDTGFRVQTSSPVAGSFKFIWETK